MKKLCLMISAIFCLLVNSMAQDRTVSGKVTDEKGTPVANASVIVKGTTTGATTAADGTYSITLPPNAKTLEFSFLGFETQTVNVGARKSISVSLVAAGGKELAEVVVTGINRIKKSEYTGATTKLIAKDIEHQPVGSFDQILQGRVPGLLSLTGSGAPGTAATVIIRGTSSIAGTSDPLYIVDGIQVEKNVFQGLNPNDFATIDVLRDAASAALYGSRGSAGVIVITTKRGSTGKIKFSYSGQSGVKTVPDFAFRPMNTAELLKAQEDYGKIVGASASQLVLPGWYYSTSNPRFATLTPDQQTAEQHTFDSIKSINTNWNDQVFRRGSFNNHQITISGGTGKTKIYSSLAFYKEEGTTLRTDMSRVTANNNLDLEDDRIIFSVSSNLAYTKRNFQQSDVTNSLGNPFLTSAVNVPYAKVTNDDGSYATGNGASFSGANQLDLTKYDENYNDQLKGILSISAGYKIIKCLTLGITTGVDFRETQNTNFGNPLAYVRTVSTSITGKAGFQTEGLTRSLIGTVRPSLTFKNTFREKHDVEVLVLGEYIREKFKTFSATGYGPDPKTPNTIAGITQGDGSNQLYSVITGGKSQNSLASGLLNARYTYNGKYTLTGSYRQDGSSKLYKDNRWKGFYSVGAVWEATKEDFISNIKPINILRLKVSYGSTGNSDNFPGGDFPYLAQYAKGEYQGLNTIYALTPGNQDLKWETTYIGNIGLDFGFFDQRIYGDLNLYNKTTKSLFVSKTLSATAGFGTGYPLDVNAGKLRNTGYELNLNGEVLRKKDLIITVFGNVAYNKNRVIDLGGVPSYETGTENIAVGLPLGSHYEVKWAGVDAATGQPLYYTKDGDIINQRRDSDRVQTFGTWEAPWKGGFGASAKFRGFELSVLFSWERGSTKVDNMEFFTENPVGFLSVGYNQSSDLHFWQKPGDQVNTPSPLYGTDFSSKLIHDASFLRLRDLVIAYNIPKPVLNRIRYLSNARLYVEGSNLYIWTKWRGRDPEAGATNINLSEFPNPRTITAGLDITF